MFHRCRNGWEKTRCQANDNYIFEIGHGKGPLSAVKQVDSLPEKNLAFGYSGVLFNSVKITGSMNRSASDLLRSLTTEITDGQQTNTGYIEEGLKEIVREEMIDTKAEAKLTALEGAFTAAFISGNTTRLIRDAAGVKVLYWHQHKDRLVFASEIKALFADPLVPKKMRFDALPEYLTFSFVPGKGTMFEDIFELQPGTMLTYRHDTGSVSCRRYFQFEAMEWNETDTRTEAAHAASVRSDLEESVRECIRINPGNPPAVFLSGGIDSSAVAAIAAREFPDIPLKTFSVHFGSKYTNENDFVSMMTTKYGTDHTWLEIKPPKFIKEMRKIIWRLDDPIGDPITVPNYLLSQAAASHGCHMVLNGEGGDPCFGGPKNILMMMASLYGPPPGEDKELWLEKAYLFTYRKCFEDLHRLLNPELFGENLGKDGKLPGIISPFLEAPMPQHFLNKLMAINIRLKGANLILVKVDKMSSANGIMALPPLFSKRIIETSMACPPTLKLSGNIEKGILKTAVKDIVPSPIVTRPKSGMMVPVRFWLRGEMKRYANRVLSEKNIKRQGFFNVDYVKNLLKYGSGEPLQSNRYGLKLWMLITFMIWYEQMVENKH